MTRSDLITYIKDIFQPLTLSIPDDVIGKCIDRVIQYWNVNSAHRTLRMYDSANQISIDTDLKDVFEVIPSAINQAQGLADPTWQLLGLKVLNYITTDFIAINEAYKSYLGYFGSDFRWTFERSNDISVKGILYLQNIPSLANKVAVIGAKRILSTDDIKDEIILDWIQRASISHVKSFEGNVLRKAQMIDIKSDGQQLIDEGKEEWDKLREELAVNSRWFCFGKRI